MRRLIACFLSLSLLLCAPRALAAEGEDLILTATEELSAEGTALDEEGDPAGDTSGEEPVEDTSLCREVGDLLKTEEHDAYIFGYQGKFRPTGQITRGETAQLFYTLLRESRSRRRAFPTCRKRPGFIRPSAPLPPWVRSTATRTVPLSRGKASPVRNL